MQEVGHFKKKKNVMYVALVQRFGICKYKNIAVGVAMNCLLIYQISYMKLPAQVSRKISKSIYFFSKFSKAGNNITSTERNSARDCKSTHMVMKKNVPPGKSFCTFSCPQVLITLQAKGRALA